MDIKEFKKLPIMGILRGVDNEVLEPLAEAIIASKLRTVEIAMNTPSAAQQIKKMVQFVRGKLVVGAGTVLDIETLTTALDAGASFVVMPVFVEEVASYCVKKNVPFFPELSARWKYTKPGTQALPWSRFSRQRFSAQAILKK